MRPVARYVDFIQAHSRATIAIVLALTLLVGSGGLFVDGGFVIAGFDTDAPEAEAADYIDERFGDQDTAVTIVAHRDIDGERALTKPALIESLELQQAIREEAAVQATLDGDRPSIGLANVVAIEALAATPGTVSLDEQLEAIEDRQPGEIAELVESVTTDPNRETLRLLPADIDLPTTTAGAHLTIVTHDLGEPIDPDDPPASYEDAQLAIAELADGYDGTIDHFAFGPAIVDERSADATGDSFALLGPLALVLVVGFLVFAYRDIVDVLLALGGIVLVLVWMAGIIGHLGIEVTQILIAVPFLLIGLSIDYALHVIMRYREERAATEATVSSAALLGFTGVIVAIGATTVTTAIGFFSNLTSEIGSISDFGLLSGLGIIAAFIIFGTLLPAAKYELELALERRGYDRTIGAFASAGVLGRVLEVGATVARRMPVALVVVMVLISAAGVYGGANVDTNIDQNDFLPNDRPGWMDHLPEPIKPDTYTIKEQALFLQANFAGADARSMVDILIRGEVATAETMAAVESAGAAVRESEATYRFATGEAAVMTPLDAIEQIAETDPTVADRLDAADSTGNGIPDTDVDALLDAAFAADAGAMEAVAVRGDDGSYEALRIDITVRGDAPGPLVVTELREAAELADAPVGVSAIATGSVLLLALVQDEVLETLITTFAITLVLVGGFLTVLFFRRHRSVALGGVTMVPVLVALSWILGAMYLLDIPYNSETAIITAIAIGIGVDFAIHMTERYLQERDRLDDPSDALSAAIRGTGGAILASAATTVLGFGILALTLVPSLQRFGIVTGLTIAFAFIASVLVLPSLLVLWDRYSAHEHRAMVIDTGNE